MPQEKMIKLSQEDQKKLAQIEQFDREQAFELGFAKHARDMGLSESEYERFYDVACQKLSS